MSNVVWFRTPKCAGRGIRQQLEHYNCYVVDKKPQIGKILCVRPETDWRKSRDRDRAFWDSSWKFAIVRNPWDRFISGCEYIKQKYPRRCKHLYTKPIRKIAFDLPKRRNSLGEVHITRSLSSILTHEGELLVDFVVRFERLEEDWEEVCLRLGRNIPLKKTNASRRKPYQHYFDKDPALRDRIAEVFAEDIERFGYTYEDYKKGR